MSNVKVDVKDLLAAGAHFGHKTSRWHPKMAEYIHSKRNDAHIIDLFKTAERLEPALELIADSVNRGKQVLFVGTKRQAKDIVRSAADEVNMPFVTERWLGGMLTNSKTMSGRVKRLKDLEERMASGELAQRYNKLEVQRFQEEIDRLNMIFGGIKNMAAQPGVVFVTDVHVDHIAVLEAKRLGAPVVGVVDTNVDPTIVDYPIPANDDAIKAIELICSYVVAAIQEGAARPPKKAKTTGAGAEHDDKASSNKRPAAKKTNDTK